MALNTPTIRWIHSIKLSTITVKRCREESANNLSFAEQLNNACEKEAKPIEELPPKLFIGRNRKGVGVFLFGEISTSGINRRCFGLEPSAAPLGWNWPQLTGNGYGK